jgi:hypothetical protein
MEGGSRSRSPAYDGGDSDSNKSHDLSADDSASE